MSTPADIRFLTSPAWRALRPVILKRDGYRCRMCSVILTDGRKGDRAAVIDHIRPRSLRPDLALDPDNCWALCRLDHDGPCASIEARHAGDADAIAAAKASWRPVGVDGCPVGW